MVFPKMYLLEREREKERERDRQTDRLRERQRETEREKRETERERRERESEAWFLVTFFNITISQIFPENVIETPQVVQKI